MSMVNQRMISQSLSSKKNHLSLVLLIFFVLEEIYYPRVMLNHIGPAVRRNGGHFVRGLGTFNQLSGITGDPCLNKKNILCKYTINYTQLITLIQN